MAKGRLDLMVFGATGFTGKHVVKELAKFASEKELTFGVSGRRKEALEAVLKEYAPDYEHAPIVIADIKDEESLKKMSERAKVVLNCCGPYRFFGEPVIKACIATRTHCVDVSGEPQFMERMQLEYNKAATDAGVYIISACGFDSIPADLGVIFIQKMFGGVVNSIESYLEVKTKHKPVLNYGTWESAVYGLAYESELRSLRSKLFPEKLPPLLPKLKTRLCPWHNAIGKWAVPFLGSDRSVMLRSQRFLYGKYKRRPAQIQTYLVLPSWFAAFKVIIAGLFFSLLTKFQCGRNLLLKYPERFSFGYISREGPSEEAMATSEFNTRFIVSGWSKELTESTDKHNTDVNQALFAEVSARNPGYGATCTALVLAGITVLKEADKMPNDGGVLPPGAAFSETSLIDELNKNGMTFKVLVKSSY